MTAETLDESLMTRFRDLITDQGARGAFDYVATRAASLPGYRCEPRQKGVVQDFRFYDSLSDEQPFALIVNRTSLLFYVRGPGLRRLRGGRKGLEALSLEISENKRGEFKIRVSTPEQAASLMDYLFPGSRRESAGVVHPAS